MAAAVAPVFAPSPDASLLSVAKSESFNSVEEREVTVDDIEDFEDDDLDAEEFAGSMVVRRSQNDASDLASKLPTFATGITDDDLRETAYEVLLACAGASGGLIVPSKEKKKDKKSRLMRKLGRSKTQSLASQSDRAPGMVGLLETMRAQMELFMLEEGLINHPVVGFGESGRKGSELRILLAKIEESEFRESSAGEVQRTVCLRSLREIAIQLAERPARGDLTGEVCHWADGYHLNIKLYEKLLLSMFDILDDGKLTEFVITRELGVLHHAIEQLNRIPLREQRGPQERLHLKSLSSRVDGEELSFLQSFLSPIQKWADKRLGDYHPHFSEDPATVEGILQVAIVTRRLLVEESETALDRQVVKSESATIKLGFSDNCIQCD
ncbi:Protein unc-13 homolog [Linum perenne]